MFILRLLQILKQGSSTSDNSCFLLRNFHVIIKVLAEVFNVKMCVLCICDFWVLRHLSLFKCSTTWAKMMIRYNEWLTVCFMFVIGIGIYVLHGADISHIK